ncbi:T9SS type A sorting domain-containing protein [Flavobacterium sp. XS1P32]|uniref:T9SS type A sorting domain-containing protein n=1 Tax=unclassified Flavobacterium TaxID=196869 RepID=UPI003AAE57AA
MVLDNEVIVRKTVSNLSVNQTLLNESKIILYPNPTKNEIHLDIDETIRNEIKKISIYNVLGQEVFSSNKYVQTIQISNISSGKYMIKISTSEFEISKKLIVE